LLLLLEYLNGGQVDIAVISTNVCYLCLLILHLYI
jgi:hypothetical protein